jgi:hypothetical protein
MAGLNCYTYNDAEPLYVEQYYYPYGNVTDSDSLLARTNTSV